MLVRPLDHYADPAVYDIPHAIAGLAAAALVVIGRWRARAAAPRQS